MHSKKFAAALMAVALGAGSIASAQPRDGWQGDRRGGPPHGQMRGGPDHGGPRGRGPDMHARDGRGAGPDHRWYRGDRLPAEYRSRQYVVDDWRGHRLSAPPRGYQWVQVGGDYVLAAIATGVIASLILNQ